MKMKLNDPQIFYFHDDKERTIAISLEEYKELLVIKGKYEQLKNILLLDEKRGKHEAKIIGKT